MMTSAVPGAEPDPVVFNIMDGIRHQKLERPHPAEAGQRRLVVVVVVVLLVVVVVVIVITPVVVVIIIVVVVIPISLLSPFCALNECGVLRNGSTSDWLFKVGAAPDAARGRLIFLISKAGAATMSAAAAAVARTPVLNLRRRLPPASGVASSGTAMSGVVASSSSCSIIL